jgi:hypothetical protein
MKILAVGDLHGDLMQARRLAQLAEKESVDLVVLNGDFTFSEQHTPGLIKAFKDKGKQVALLPGNHESAATSESLAKAYGAINLHGYYVRFGDVGIFGCGSANLGIFQLPERELYGILKQAHEKIKDCKKKIMLTHVHPADTKIEMGMFAGSSAVTRAIKAFKPDIAICSHIHEADGIEDTLGSTRLICASKKGKIIEV